MIPITMQKKIADMARFLNDLRKYKSPRCFDDAFGASLEWIKDHGVKINSPFSTIAGAAYDSELEKARKSLRIVYTHSSLSGKEDLLTQYAEESEYNNGVLTFNLKRKKRFDSFSNRNLKIYGRHDQLLEEVRFD